MNLSALRLPALLALATAALILSACGSPSGAAPGTSQSPAAADNGGGDTAGAGTEAAGVRFVSSRFHYRVDAPGPMVEAGDGTATASRGGERMSIRVVSGASAADLRTYAGTDLGSVRDASLNYRPVGGLAAVTVGGRAAFKAVYQWTDATNPVTGKPLDLVSVRYYIPRDAANAAVVAYSITASQYDPQGADDVAATFAWQ